MNIVTNLVRVLVLTFVFVGGAITFAGPQTLQNMPADDNLEPATVLNAQLPAATPTERASTEDTEALRNSGNRDVG